MAPWARYARLYGFELHQEFPRRLRVVSVSSEVCLNGHASTRYSVLPGSNIAFEPNLSTVSLRFPGNAIFRPETRAPKRPLKAKRLIPETKRPNIRSAGRRQSIQPSSPPHARKGWYPQRVIRKMPNKGFTVGGYKCLIGRCNGR